MGRSTVRRGASIGAGAVIIPGLEIGRYAMIGAGAVVTRDVPAHALVVGNPAKQIGWICACGRERMDRGPRGNEVLHCDRCSSKERTTV
jgi:UDP-2-acetamido-3-amino-2,3-dideoxy-glucuronate N-acetyltransferase